MKVDNNKFMVQDVNGEQQSNEFYKANVVVDT